jgi:hypothetical protein
VPIPACGVSLTISSGAASRSDRDYDTGSRNGSIIATWPNRHRNAATRKSCRRRSGIGRALRRGTGREGCKRHRDHGGRGARRARLSIRRTEWGVLVPVGLLPAGSLSILDGRAGYRCLGIPYGSTDHTIRAIAPAPLSITPSLGFPKCIVPRVPVDNIMRFSGSYCIFSCDGYDIL